MMRRRRVRIAPFLADTFLVELLSGLAFLVGIFGGYFLQGIGTPSGRNSTGVSSGTRVGLALIIGLLAALLVDLFVDRMAVRGRRGRLEKIEAALSDGNVIAYFVTVTDCYREAAANIERSRHPGLYNEVAGGLLRAEDWLHLKLGRLPINDPARELRIAQDLLPTAKKRVRAIAVADDLDYLESHAGEDYLNEQGRRIAKKKKGLKVRRLFVYSSQDAAALNVTVEALAERVRSEAHKHHAKHVVCRILRAEAAKLAKVSAHEVPDINIYDEHTVRYSTLQLGGGRMQAVVSENYDEDIRPREVMFENLWDIAEPYPAQPGPAANVSGTAGPTGAPATPVATEDARSDNELAGGAEAPGGAEAADGAEAPGGPEAP